MGLNGSLAVTVVSAEGLPPQHHSGNLHCDPYCSVRLLPSGASKVRLRSLALTPGLSLGAPAILDIASSFSFPSFADGQDGRSKAHTVAKVERSGTTDRELARRAFCRALFHRPRLLIPLLLYPPSCPCLHLHSWSCPMSWGRSSSRSRSATGTASASTRSLPRPRCVARGF